LQQLERLLADPNCRLLTIVGPGGIGKTRLALEAARRYLQTDVVLLEPDVRDGVYIVSLASIGGGQTLTTSSDPTSLSNALVSAIADAVDTKAFQGNTDLRRQLLAYLRPKAILLVLDNFEHLIIPEAGQPGLDLAATILQQAPQVKKFLSLLRGLLCPLFT
jgi:predicted ATPase